MKIEDLKSVHEPVFYVTNDVGRGIGLENLLPNYHLVCLDDHPLVDILQSKGISVFCLERSLGKQNVLARVSGNILSQPEVLAFIKEKAKDQTPQILFFKPQKKMEILASKHHFNLLGNAVEQNRFFEDKVSFFEFCQKTGIKAVPGEIADLQSLDFRAMVQRYGEVLVIQFGRGWAGSSTFFVSSEEELEKLKKDFGTRRVKISRLIKGITILNNAVVLGEQILMSRPALQIKSYPLLTAAPGGTGGRQWPSPLSIEQEKEIEAITQKIGQLMAQAGYRGFFGLDFLLEEASGEIFVSENNARLTASVPFYTKRELAIGTFPLLAYHLLSFMKPEVKVADWEAPAVEGSEVVIRNSTGSAVRLLETFPAGIYRFPLQLVKEDYFLSGNNQEEFWLTTAAKGRQVNPEIELARLNTPGRVADERGEIKEEYRQLIARIRNEIKWQKC